MMNELVDKHKLALLQERLGVATTTDDQAPTYIAPTRSPALEVDTNPNPEVIDICEVSDPGSKDKSDDKPVVDWPKSLLRYEEHSNSNHSKHGRDGGDDKKDNTPKRQKQDGVDPSPEFNNSRGAVTGMRKLETYFQSNGPSSFASANKTASSSKSVASSNSDTAASSTQSNTSTTTGSLNVTHITTTFNTHSSSHVTMSSIQSEKTNAAIAAATADLKKQNEQLRLAKDQHEQKAQRLEAELRSLSDRLRQSEERNLKLSNSLEEVYRRMALQEARRKRDRLAQDNVRLGKIQTVRTSATSMGDVWEEGYALKELEVRCAEVALRRDELEKRRNRLKAAKRKYMAKVSAGGDVSCIAKENSFDSTVVNDGYWEPSTELEIISEESALRSHMDQLKRDESALLEERHLLEAEKAAHQKEIKRCLSEDRSRFFKEHLPCLHKRYLLLSMLGRGGFSEVWKALDLVELREVAVKIHQLNPTWSEARKQSYVKHVTREYTIHRDLKHPRVVLLFDVFEIDVNSFATVLELCHGTDLDEKLKTQKTIPEKDAKTILMQIIFGLRYLNAGPSATAGVSACGDDGAVEKPGSPTPMGPPVSVPRRRSIIHFDLKPANILFDSMGDVKITDFGLSKILNEADEGVTSVELTSQGAGTYWYLPPECFDRGDAPPRISSKVDVWSLGVILYQMLYGKRPSGEGKSQERVLSEGIMLNATRVDFPQEGAKTSPNGTGVSSLIPKVSEEGKDFIRACLTWDQKHRPDVMQLSQHPYLKPQSKKS